MGTKIEKVLLVQPPYLRLMGSHNDRVPLELCYLNSYLKAAGIASLVFNADWTGASKYIEWKRLFKNSIFLQNAVDGNSPLFDETLERILSLEPSVVILAAADSLTPWVDLGNAYSTSILSQMLIKNGVYTIGVGPFYSRIPEKFIDKFDSILVGAASPTIVNVVQSKPKKQIIRGAIIPPSASPLIDVHPSSDKDDVVMTAVGCVYTCTFCLAQKRTNIELSLDIVENDIASRKSKLVDFGDAVLPINMKRIKDLTNRVKHLDKKFACEISVARVTPDVLEALKDLGIVSLKIGVESGDDKQLDSWGKKQAIEKIHQSVKLIKEYGFYLTIYVLLGGSSNSLESAKKTLDLCRRLQGDDYVINVLAFHDLEQRDFRYDAHFSDHLVDLWGIRSIMPDFFDLQPKYKPGLGQLL